MKRDSERGEGDGEAKCHAYFAFSSKHKTNPSSPFLCISQQYVTCDEDISFRNFQGTIARVPRTMKKDGSITSLTIIYNLGSGNSRLAFSWFVIYLTWNNKILDPQWNIEFRQRWYYPLELSYYWLSRQNEASDKSVSYLLKRFTPCRPSPPRCFASVFSQRETSSVVTQTRDGEWNCLCPFPFPSYPLSSLPFRIGPLYLVVVPGHKTALQPLPIAIAARSFVL